MNNSSAWFAHESDAHESTAMSRERPGDVRDGRSDVLDDTATDADRSAEERDVQANTRDDEAVAREIAHGGLDMEASHARHRAHCDRLDAAGDRRLSARMRVHASADRTESAKDRWTSSFDELTGTYRRDPGMIELARDLTAATRTEQSMVVGFLDVDGLKTVNDERGHAAGDRVLQAVSSTLRSNLRQYDLIVRYGGDEFVFSIVGIPEPDVHTRVDTVNQELKAHGHNTVTYALATPSDGETLCDAIERADRSLYELRRRRV